jgi:predicted ester cyclase
MSIKENKELVRHIYELIDRGEMDAYAKYCAPDFVEHFTDRDLSQEQVIKFDAGFGASFLHLGVTIKNMVAEGDKVAYRVNMKGTHTGPFMGIAPTGKKFEMNNTYIVKIVANKWVEQWGTTEFPLLMQQLGAIPKQ